MSKSDGSGPSIQVLARAFSLLDVLAAHTAPVPLKELSARTGLHPLTAHRILNDLTEGRFEWVLEDPAITDQLRIPMLAGRRSLNLSTAVGVASYEALRQLQG